MKHILRRVVSCILFTVFVPVQATPVGGYSIAPPFVGVDGAERPLSEEDSVSFDFQLDEAGSRFFVDFPLRRGLPPDATSFAVEGRFETDGFVTGITLHMRVGMKWFGTTLPLPMSRRSRVAVPLGRLRNDSGEMIDFSRADQARISVWAGASNVTGRLVLYRMYVRRDAVAIVNTGDSIALERCRSLFDAAGIPYAEIPGDFSTAGEFQLVAIPEVVEPLQTTGLRDLRKAVGRGTRVMVFYSGSREMGDLLGIEPGVWLGAKPEAPWRAVVPVAKECGGFDDWVPHQTANIIPPYARRKVVPVAVWADALGRETDVPACVVSSRGAWFAHLPPLPVSPATEFFRRICLRFVPTLVEDFAVAALMENTDLLDGSAAHTDGVVAAKIRHAVETREGLSEIPRLCVKLRDSAARALLAGGGGTGEVRAVWDPRARFRSAAERSNILGRLSGNGINTVFAFTGDAQSSSGCDGLVSFIEHAHAVSIQFHAWIYALALDDHNGEARKQFAREGRLMVSASGGEHAWLCPVQAKNRALLVETATGLAQAGADGIHLDYMRFPDVEGCFCRVCRLAFEARVGKAVRDWPADVVSQGKQAKAYRAFQAEVLTQLVSEIASAVRHTHPGALVSAAVFPESVSAVAHRQDWPTWVQVGDLDFVCPMTYQIDDSFFASQLRRAIAACGEKPSTILPGIGTTADARGPDGYGAALQVAESRRLQCRGFAFFSLDDYLFDSILPVMELNTTH